MFDTVNLIPMSSQFRVIFGLLRFARILNIAKKGKFYFGSSQILMLNKKCQKSQNN